MIGEAKYSSPTAACQRPKPLSRSAALHRSSKGRCRAIDTDGGRGRRSKDDGEMLDRELRPGGAVSGPALATDELCADSSEETISSLRQPNPLSC